MAGSKTNTNFSVEKLLEFETKFASGSEDVAPLCEEEKSLYARIKEIDARKSEAIISVASHPVEKVRSMLLRGDLSAAQKEIEQHFEAAPNEVSSAAQIELLHERIRHSVFEGHWELGLELSNRVLGLDCPAVTRLSAHQMRAICNFEMGAFRKSFEDIERVAALGKLYPKAQPLFYALAYRPKVMARIFGFDRARAELDKLWNDEIAAGKLNADRLIVLARAETDLAFFAGTCGAGFSHLSQVLSNKVGDRVYEALGLFSFWVATPWARQRNAIDVAEHAKNFRRVRVSFENIHGGPFDGVGTTAETERRVFVNGNQCAICPTLNDTACKYYWIKRHGIFLSLGGDGGGEADGLKWAMLKENSLNEKLLLSILEGKNSQEEIFRSLYGSMKFSAHVHGNTLRNAISRLRKKLSVNVTTEGSRYLIDRLRVIHP